MIANLQLARRGLGSPLPCNVLLPANYSGHPVSWREAQGHYCKWVIAHSIGETDSLVCGAPTEPGHSFCRAHHVRVFTKPKDDGNA